MKKTLSQYDIANELHNDENNGYSWQGCLALAEWLDENLDENEEFDRVAIRCDYSEYESALKAALEYGYDPDESEPDDDESEEEREDKAQVEALEWLESQTMVLQFDDGIIIQDF